jgi:hypothetical protein
MPALRTSDNKLAETSEEKVNTLRNMFFPQLPEADLSDLN